MELDKEQEELWNSYTEENREKCFWLFLNTFVDKWEKQVMMMMMIMVVIKTMMMVMMVMTLMVTMVMMIFSTIFSREIG